MKKVALLALVAGVITAVFGAGSAAAAVCTPVVSSNGEALTVLLYNPGAVTGTVNAAGCDVAVYSDAGTTTITNADIFGANKYGVFIDKGAVGTISNSDVHDISVPFDGVQQGVAVAYRAGSDGWIDNSRLYRYQKNGTVFSGEGTQVSITNSTVTGLGRVAFIAQNGIQYSSGASGVARGNTVTNHYYTGCTAKDQAQTGCTWYWAAGIILFDVDANEVDTSKNTFRDNQRNLLLVTSSSLG